ncbi:hypothetical protein [Microbacterium sp.]
MSLPYSTAQRWLSPHRLGVYMTVTSGDSHAALELYEWNAEVASACLRDVGHFEVIIRNRYEERLTPHQSDWTAKSSPLWVAENGIEQTRRKQRYSNRKSRDALDRALQDAPQATPGHIIANLMFGFWASMTRSERESTIWTPILSGIFPGKGRGPIHDQMTKLNNFRNRLAHWEPVFSNTTGLEFQLRKFDELFTLVDNDVANWVGARSTVLDTIDECPVPGLSLSVSSYLGRTPTDAE